MQAITVRINPDGTQARLDYACPSPVGQKLAITAAVPLGLCALFLGHAALTRLTVLESALGFALIAGLGAVLVRFHARHYPHSFVVNAHGVQVGGRLYPFDDLAGTAIADQSAGHWDVVTGGVPRNLTLGPHLVLKVGPDLVPITPASTLPQITTLQAELDALIRRFRPQG